MSGVPLSATTPEVATGTSLKTILQLQAGANHRVLVNEIAIAFKGTSATNAPILVEVVRQTTSGTGMTSLTPKKLNSSDSETLESSARHGATAEPTSGDVLMSHLVHPQSGYTWQAPFGRQIVIPGNGRIGIRVHAGVGVNCTARIMGEE